MKRLLRSGQPLYPPDIVPVAHSSSQQSESEKSASQKAVTVSLDFPVDSSSSADPCKSNFAIMHDQSNLKGETCPTKACLNSSGTRTRSSGAVDATVFPPLW